MVFTGRTIEPVHSNPAIYRWDQVNEAGLVNLVEHGIEPIGIVLYTPQWAQKYPGVSCGPVAETSMEAFSQFLTALVSRYSQPPYNVHIWEIGNEPDIAPELVPKDAQYGCWGDSADPYYGGGYYAQMLEKAYPAIKAADPLAQVLVGGLLMHCDPVNPPETSPGSGQFVDCKPSKFLEGILIHGGGPYFDGVSYHSYDYFLGNGTYGNPSWHSHSTTTGPVINAKTAYLRDLLAAYGIPEKKLYSTEAAILCGQGTEPACSEVDFLNTKAAYAAQVNAAALVNGVSVNIWYSLTGWRASGLVDGLRRPLDAFQALRFSNEELQGVVFTRQIEEYPGLFGYEFIKPDQRIWMMWSLDGFEHQLPFSEPPSRVLDVQGRDLVVQDVLRVGLQPNYIEWPLP